MFEIVGVLSTIYVIIGVGLTAGILFIDRKRHRDALDVPMGFLALVMIWPVIAFVLWRETIVKGKGKK